MGSSEAFAEYYKSSKDRIGAKIAKINEDTAKKEGPHLLNSFYSDFADLNAGGKLLRGVLCDIGYRIGGGKEEGYSDPLSIAFELFQTGVLIHDDIIDHADLRRGKETIHRRYKKSLAERKIEDLSGDTPESAAICAGDIGIYLANKMLADSYEGNENAAKLISYFDKIVLDTINGELLDVILPSEMRSPLLSSEEKRTLLTSSVWEIYRLKTAGYSVIGPIHSGMLLAGAPDEHMKAIDEYSEQLGIAFQIKDDILGIFGDEAVIGKDIGSDIEEGKLTALYEYVYVNDEEAHRKLCECYGKSPVGSREVEKVREIFEKTGALTYAKNRLSECLEKAEEILSGCEFLSDDDRDILEGLAGYLGKRTR